MGQDLKRAAKEGERIAFRIIAAVIGAVGAIALLIVNIVLSTKHALTGGAQTHGWYGVLAFVVAAIGAMATVFSPKVGAVLMALAGIGFIVIAHIGAVFAVPILAVAAVIAWIDRSKLSAN